MPKVVLSGPPINSQNGNLLFGFEWMNTNPSLPNMILFCFPFSGPLSNSSVAHLALNMKEVALFRRIMDTKMSSVAKIIRYKPTTTGILPQLRGFYINSTMHPCPTPNTNQYFYQGPINKDHPLIFCFSVHFCGQILLLGLKDH